MGMNQFSAIQSMCFATSPIMQSGDEYCTNMQWLLTILFVPLLASYIVYYHTRKIPLVYTSTPFKESKSNGNYKAFQRIAMSDTQHMG